MFSKGMSLTADVVADLGGGFARKNGDSHHLVVGYSPCLTKTRCKSASYYLFSKQRKMQLAEMYKLQGIPVGRVRKPKTVSESQMRGMLGNTFTVPVVARIVDRILYAVGTTSELQCRGYDVDVEAAIWTGPPPAQKLPAKRVSKTGQSQGSGTPPLKKAKRA